MPKNFSTNKRLLSYEEKIRRAIFYYTYEDLDFDLVYEDEENPYDEYGQPLIAIEENLNKLDLKTKELVLEFTKKEIYDETVTFKCLYCGDEMTEDLDIIEEIWDEHDSPYPTLMCERCHKNKLVPLDIYKRKKKY